MSSPYDDDDEYECEQDRYYEYLEQKREEERMRMTLAEAKEKFLLLEQNKQLGKMCSFLSSSNGGQLLNDKTVREKALKIIEIYLTSLKEGRTTASSEEHLAAVQLQYNIEVMNAFERNYVRSGIFMFKKGTPHLRR